MVPTSIPRLMTDHIRCRCDLEFCGERKWQSDDVSREGRLGEALGCLQWKSHRLSREFQYGHARTTQFCWTLKS